MIQLRNCSEVFWLVALMFFTAEPVTGQSDAEGESSPVAATQMASQAETGLHTTFDELKAAGASRSGYRKRNQPPVETESPKPSLDSFRDLVKPVLDQSCVRCHGAESQEGNIRIDTLDPDLLRGNDVERWLEVLAVMSNGEMPPADEPRIADKERSAVVDWLSAELQTASAVRRSESPHSSFRRLTRYEYNYSLQDLFGVPYDFARDLPPESTSEDGFQNSSELLHLSANQLATYRDLGLAALRKVTVTGERPALIHWGVTMKAASSEAWAQHERELDEIRKQFTSDPEKLKAELDRRTAALNERLGSTHYKNLTTGQSVRAAWDYGDAKYARQPTATLPEVPLDFEHVAIIPPKQRLIVELGDTVPDTGTLRVRVRASRITTDDRRLPSMQLEFGWQASNDSQATVRISKQDIVVDALPDQPRFYQWEVPLSEVHPRNTMRGVWKLGDLPNPSEYIRLVNSSVSQSDIQVDYVEVTAPIYEQWPPASHTRVFIDSDLKAVETTYAKEVLASFMRRAWRRQPSEEEVEQKLALFTKIRPECDDFEQAMTEVLATVLSSPKFLYIVQSGSQTDGDSDRSQTLELTELELATRLSMFLWCSGPDEELIKLAENGRLSERSALTGQVQRMLIDTRSRRFAEQFVRQWLGMQLLDYLKVDEEIYPRFDASLKEAMQEEPVAFFQEVLKENHSVLDFLHADYTMANERLSQHYEIDGVFGNQFRRVAINPDSRRGGLLTQAGLLAMNSDGKDSHPLKRGIWLLKSLLNDPPPLPPPAVPAIDLADPEIAKMTIKQRIENHRNQAACLSCHAKIDPWGIAFENFDAVGGWRDDIAGKPVDASSLLFNGQRLDGVDALKRFLLENRQDQFTRAMVHKMATFAIGRPLTFGDHAGIDEITTDVRMQGDGLVTMVELIVNSKLFLSK